jgi:hypothetical protein
MPAPVALAAIPIITAAGRFAAPYLAKELGKLGMNKFVSTYGKGAFNTLESLNKNTTMVKPEAMPMVNPEYNKGTKSESVATTGAGLVIGGAPKEILPPPEPFTTPEDRPTDTTVSTPIPTPIDTVEEFPSEDKPLPKTPGFGEGGKIDIPIIISMKDGNPEFKYPTEEEIKEYINEENKFWKQNIQQIKEKNPEFSVENMPQVVDADKHFGAAAYTFQNYDDSKLIYMSPDEYLSLTKKYRPEEGKEQLGSKMNVKNLENILREGGELANIPTLYIKKPFEDLDTFEVVGQEGNHRAKAFKNLGYDKIPVVVEGYTRDDRVKTKDVFPTNIISYSNYNKDKKEYEQYDSVSTKPTDFYNVLTKEKLIKADDVSAQTEKLIRGIGDNNPPSAIEEETTVSKTTPREYKGEIIEGTGLNQNLKDAIAKYAGTPEDIAKSLKMPQSHKKKIYIQLEEFLNENYPSKLSEKEQEVESDALFYIANSVYDIYTYRGEGDMPRDTLMVQDDIGFPLATAEIERYPKGKLNYYPKRKKGNKYVKTEPAIYIETIGSLNKDATSNILDQVEKIAESEGVRYIVAEDLTSEAAAKAFEKRGFVPAKKGFFEGDIINEADWRGGKKNVKQKNMVLDLGKKYQTTEKEIQEEFVKEQTDKLLKNK